jgi:superfamily II DNA or RNA helicase
VVKESGNAGGLCLVLSDRKAHCETLLNVLKSHGIEAHLLTGKLSAKERKAVVQDLAEGNVRVLVATGQLIGEGFDSKMLSTLFLACPVKFSGRLLQYLGRVLRPAPGKETVRIFDYQDRQVGVLMSAARARQRVYQTAA